MVAIDMLGQPHEKPTKRQPYVIERLASRLGGIPYSSNQYRTLAAQSQLNITEIFPRWPEARSYSSGVLKRAKLKVRLDLKGGRR
jgi:hypothetical protein